jgi:putative redox protein
MSTEIKTVWKGNMAFEWDVKGFKYMIDADEKAGGEGRGPQPKPFQLAALGGCTGMDVISILKKMKIAELLSDFSVEVSGELTEEHPKYYHSMHVIYRFKAHPGSILERDKLQKAVELSEEKYCGVGALYRKAGVKMRSEIVIE